MNNYYLIYKKRIVREVKLAIPHSRRFIVDSYDAELADAVVDEMFAQCATFFVAGNIAPQPSQIS